MKLIECSDCGKPVHANEISFLGVLCADCEKEFVEEQEALMDHIFDEGEYVWNG